ncbi:YdbH domain-containing protein [Pelagibius sp.]|uniref:YdbH domain-containing protein n=1 Tax=Pelagibius sp. TaxID=1931238 RepID=UPI0026370AE0|nr:YdbH domain-containing protein [Pelagibius sp.]
MAPTHPQVPKGRRWPRRLAYGLGLSLLIAITGGLLFRQELTTWLLRDRLEREDITVASLKVRALTHQRIELGEVVLGDSGEISVERLQVAFALDLEAPRIEEVVVEGLRVRLDLTGEGPLLGSLQHLLGASAKAGGDGGFDPAMIQGVPRVRLDAAEILTETQAGTMTTVLTASVEPQANGAVFGRLTADAESEIGQLSAELEGGLDPQGALSLGASIGQGRIDWRNLAIGEFVGSLAVNQSPGEAPQIAADLTLADLAYRSAVGEAIAFAQGAIMASGTPADFTLATSFGGGEEQISLDLKTTLATEGESQRIEADLAVEASSAGALAGQVPVPSATLERGRMTFVADLAAVLPGEAETPRSWQALAALLREAEGRLDGDLILADLALADGSEGISAHLPLTARREGDKVTVGLTEDMEIRVEQAATERLAALGLAREYLPLFESDLSLVVAAGGSRPAALSMDAAWPLRAADLQAEMRFSNRRGLAVEADIVGSGALTEDGLPAQFSGDVLVGFLAERLPLAEAEARGLELSLPLALTYNAEGLGAALKSAGSLAIAQLARDLPLRLKRQLSLSIDEAEFRMAPSQQSYSYRLQGQGKATDAQVLTTADTPLEVRLGSSKFSVTGSFESGRGHDATAETAVASLGVPAYGITAETVIARTALDAELAPLESRFSVASLHSDTDPPLVAPLAIDGELQRRGAGYDVAADVTLTTGPRLGRLEVRYDDAGTAKARFQSRFLRFAPDALQPADLSPLLADLEDVEGRLFAEATFVWPQNPAEESARLVLEDLSFRSQGVAVEDLSLDLALRALLPLRSEPDQRLSIGRIDAGAPLEDMTLRFEMAADPQPQLQVAGGGFTLGGAQWRLGATRLDPTAPDNSLLLATDNLDLATFFRLIEVEGLSGRGLLAGQIPILFDGENLVVSDGRLTAQAPGQLSIRSQALASALSGGGETVELAVKALEDFRYEDLSITVNMSANNDAQVLLSLLGQNPAVLDGQPFRFNINLESNLTSVLEALRQGYSLSDEALRRAWQLRQ